MHHEYFSDLHELQLLKARYFRYLDTKQWEKWRGLFADDVEVYLESTRTPQSRTPTIVGADAFVADVARRNQSTITLHHGHTPEIEFVNDRTADGIWAMFDWISDEQRGRAMQGYGHYHETYIKGADDIWRIKVLRLTRLRVNRLPALPSEAHPWISPPSPS